MGVGSSSNGVGTACTELADNDFYLADFHRENTLEEAHLMAKAAAYAIDHNDPLVAMNKELVRALKHSNQVVFNLVTLWNGEHEDDQIELSSLHLNGDVIAKAEELSLEKA
tara:strand:- start:8286 stop:8618 length:333 start_codon:yes stop_codon:yes gene_type:complete